MPDAVLQSLFDASPDAVLLVDGDGRIVLANPQAHVLLGRATFAACLVEDLLPERFKGRHLGYRERYGAAPTVRSMGAGRDLVAARPDGSEVPVDIMLSPAPGAGARHVIVTLRDASERVATERRLKSNESIFRALFAQAPDAIVSVDRQGLIMRVNQSTEALFGYPGEELVGKPIELLIPERFRGGHDAKRVGYTDRPASRPMGAGLELFGRRRDGSEVPVDIMLSPVALPDGGDLVLCVIRDVTERRVAAKAIQERNEQLERSNRELEMFAYVASHDLQEPLRSVASSCQILEKRLGAALDEDTREFLGFAVDGAKRMRTLIDDLLAYSRLSRGQALTPTPLSVPIDRGLANLRAAIAESGAVIVVAPDLPVVLADAGQLALVFQNLIGNAIKFRKLGTAPKIHVSARAEGATVSVRVEDDGIGIDPRHYDRIFTLFQRLHSREEYPGTGIGLAMCKKIVERHGGRIAVESSPGKGSVFTFTLCGN